MQKRNIRLKKHLGQNFLVDKKVIQTMVEAADIDKDDVVIEIGAGTGNLTRAIAERAGKIIAFEIDGDLVSILKENLRDFNNVEIVNQDILKVDFDNLCSQYSAFDPSSGRGLVSSVYNKKIPITDYSLPTTKIVGSIPYSITSPLIHKILFSPIIFKTIVLLIQWEVAEKISSQPPKGSYLSNFAASCAKAKIVEKVSSLSFHPQPKVNSAIIKIKKFKKADEEFSKFLHQGFKYPRKILRKKFDEKLLREAGVDSVMRAQELNLHEWEKLFNLYLKCQMSNVKCQNHNLNLKSFESYV